MTVLRSFYGEILTNLELDNFYILQFVLPSNKIKTSPNTFEYSKTVFIGKKIDFL